MRRLAFLIGLLAVVGVAMAYAQVEKAPVEKTVTGTIDSVDLVKSEVVIITKEAVPPVPAVKETLVVAKDAVITLADGKAGKLLDLKKGEKVEAKVVDGKATVIKVVK